MANQPSWLILSSTNLILIFNCKFFLFCAKTDIKKRIFQIIYPTNSNLNCLNTTSKDDEQYCLNPHTFKLKMKRVLICGIIVFSLPQQLIAHMVWKLLYYYNTNLLPHPMLKKGDCQQDYLYFCWHDYQDNYLDNIIESMAFPNLSKNNHN